MDLKISKENFPRKFLGKKTQTFQEDKKRKIKGKEKNFIFPLKRHVTTDREEMLSNLDKRKLRQRIVGSSVRSHACSMVKRLDEPATDDADHCLYVTLTFINRHTFVCTSSTSSTAKNF